MDYLSVWIKGLITIVVLWSFVELLLPSADMKKYVRFAVGIIIMLTIIKPILNIKEIKIDDVNFPKQIEYSAKGTNEQVEVVYKNKLENEVLSKFNLSYVKIYINNEKQITKVELEDISQKGEIARHLGITPNTISHLNSLKD